MIELINGSLLDVLPQLDADSIDSCVTDPPYELGFMGRAWDKSGIAYDGTGWTALLRVLKPGAYVAAFGGTRTFHRVACAMEDAGFEIRDTLSWLYGQGFPKSLNVSKALDAAAGAERPVIGSRTLTGSAAMSTAEKGGTYASNTDSRGRSKEVAVTGPATELAKQWEGYGTALKPSWEPIILARKPLVGTVAANVTAHGTGALNIDACRGEGGQAKIDHDASSKARSGFSGGLSGGTLAGTADLGRWPPNVCVDEAVAADLDFQFGVRQSIPFKGGPKQKRGQVLDLADIAPGGYSDSGGVSRYFYCPKAGARERDAGLEAWPVLSGGDMTAREDGAAGVNNPRAGAGRGGGRRNPHPTVKPIELMRWLCRLVTPQGGLILDPFMGSGTTGCAAVLESFDFMGIDLDPEYVRLASDRIAHRNNAA